MKVFWIGLVLFMVVMVWALWPIAKNLRRRR